MSKKKVQTKENRSFLNHPIIIFLLLLVVGLLIKVSWNAFLFLISSYVIIGIIFNFYYRGSEGRYEFFKFFVGIFVVAIIANQLIQPMFFPRVSEITVTPQYVESYENDYELVSKQSYAIDLPLFPNILPIGSNNLELKLPSEKQGHEVYFLTKYLDSNPYVDFLIDTNPPRYNYTELDGVIPIKITTDAWHVKSLKIDLYVSQKVYWYDLMCPQGYNRFTEKANDLPVDLQIFCTNYIDSYIYVTSESKPYYSLDVHVIKNNGDLALKGFKYRNSDTLIVRVCDDDAELPFDGDEEFVFLYLKPSETKKLIFVKETEHKDIDKKKQIRNITTHECPEISKILSPQRVTLIHHKPSRTQKQTSPQSHDHE